jgi:hypothetical protein
MDKDTIEQIAAEVVARLPYLSTRLEQEVRKQFVADGPRTQQRSRDFDLL